jgi:hypothetical protein
MAPHISSIIATRTAIETGRTTMLKQAMRLKITLALLALTAFALFYTGSARAAEKEAWCAYYADQSSNCGFATFQQCEADISGVGGMCSRNPESE